MILDNSSEEKTVAAWIDTHTEEGSIDVITGYFTIGALAYISDTINSRVKRYQMVLGDIASEQVPAERPMDLLNENISIDVALELTSIAQKAVNFLKQDKVLVRTLEPNFCKAKVWVSKSKREEGDYYISGSSNLTESGLGLRKVSNQHLNLAGNLDHPSFDELRTWFSELWKSNECRDKKSVDGGKVDFKTYLIDQISQLFVKHTPRDLYYRTLFELFGRELLDFERNANITKAIGRLENTEIYRRLYEFQKKGVLSLVKMLEEFDGAILADAVGLGKTWSALAVIKFYQLKGYETVLLCPKKLNHNWRQYLRKQGSCFEKDEFDYVIRFHTDLQDRRLYTKQDGLNEEYFQSDRPKLLVIDESHNLRNSKSNRYKFLVGELLRKNDELKVLMLSATPINNSLIDVRNQFKLIVKDHRDGFRDTNLGINNIDHLFARSKAAFTQWSSEPNRNLNSFIDKLPRDFFRLTDKLIVARTRNLISNHADHLNFPRKGAPKNIYLNKLINGKYESVELLVEALPQNFASYRPAFYIDKPDHVNVLSDESLRDFFLARMMGVLLVKRLESSWHSFLKTVDRVYRHHLDTLEKVKQYKDENGESAMLPMFDPGDGDLSFEFERTEEQDLAIGKREIQVSEIDAAGQLQIFETHLEDDLAKLRELSETLTDFETQIRAESDLTFTQDEKFQKLLREIERKQEDGLNHGNQKVLIFTAFSDTADYLYKEMLRRGAKNVAMITGQVSRVYDDAHTHSDFEPILQRFCPFTKLFLEKQWPSFNKSPQCITIQAEFIEWVEWVRENNSGTAQKLDNPIDILIATDCLSEGQNLQDCDFVINYDIHWNPVRAIQRMGRIDRLGSPNEQVFVANFWPTPNMNQYLSLQKRVEERMAQMRLSGAEVPEDFTPEMKGLLEDEQIKEMQEARMLKQLEGSWDEVETNDESLGFDKLSLESYRQDLMAEFGDQVDNFENMPTGIYTGFKANPQVCPRPGLIALLGYPARQAGSPFKPYEQLHLIYVDQQGAEILPNTNEVLNALQYHKEYDRYVSELVDNGDLEELQIWKSALNQWLDEMAATTDSGGERQAGPATLNLLEQIQGGAKLQTGALKQGERFDERFKPDKFDLVLWFMISSGEIVA